MNRKAGPKRTARYVSEGKAVLTPAPKNGETEAAVRAAKKVARVVKKEREAGSCNSGKRGAHASGEK